MRILPDTGVAFRPAQRREVLQHPIGSVAVREQQSPEAGRLHAQGIRTTGESQKSHEAQLVYPNIATHSKAGAWG
jgi:hypothetical protein